MWNKFKIKALKNYVYLYDMQDVCTSLAFIIDSMTKMSTKFIPNFLNFVTLAFVFVRMCSKDNWNKTRITNRCQHDTRLRK